MSHHIAKIEPGVYRHYKGNQYEVYGVARHTETGDDLVVYKPLYEHEGQPDIWVRPSAMFIEDVNFNGMKRARFEKLIEDKRLPVFITGNQHKADYLAKLLELPLRHQKVELDELQSLDLHYIVEHKLRQAYEAVGAPVLVEDVSLTFNALGSLPGPYIKWFIEQAKPEACCAMLDSFSDRGAVIRCTFGHFDGATVTLFDSEMAGRISDKPRGSNGYGFDTIFICDGYDITRAEMTPEENEQTYRDIMKPIAKVREFLQTSV